MRLLVADEPHGRIHRLPRPTDPRWPPACGCGYVFQAADRWQVFTEGLWIRGDTGALTTLAEAPPGAMWDATWYGGPEERGPDGKCLIVKTPGGDWHIDGRANNCTLPQDRVHKCWVRHGTPPHLTVDKNGVTCSAGGGSIQAGGYHGYLRNGELVT